MYLHHVQGKVLTVVSNTNAILLFNKNGEEQRVLLRNDRIKCNGLDVPSDCNISDYVKLDIEVTFDCLSLDNELGETSPYQFNWIAVICWVYREYLNSWCSDQFAGKAIRGKCSIEGTLTNVDGFVGVLSFNEDVTGAKENAFFLGNALFLNDKEVSKTAKDLDVKPGTKVMFDAIPCCKEDNDYGCVWFATLVWIGNSKPTVPYDVIGTSNEVFQNPDLLAQIQMVSLNPRAIFLRGVGHILHIFNEEYGLALGQIRQKRMDSILFHRNMCFVLKMNLSDQDLTKIFKEGDRICFIAVPAPKKCIAQWIATSISVLNSSIKET